MDLVDQITSKKKSVRRDQHLRKNFVALSGSEYKNSVFTSQKPRGGGIYPTATNSLSNLMASASRLT